MHELRMSSLYAHPAPASACGWDAIKVNAWLPRKRLDKSAPASRCSHIESCARVAPLPPPTHPTTTPPTPQPRARSWGVTKGGAVHSCESSLHNV